MPAVHYGENAGFGKRGRSSYNKTDKYRAEYYKYYTGGDYWTNPTSYDLTINTGRVGRERAVDLIIDYLKMRFGDKLI